MFLECKCLPSEIPGYRKREGDQDRFLSLHSLGQRMKTKDIIGVVNSQPK